MIGFQSDVFYFIFDISISSLLIVSFALRLYLLLLPNLLNRLLPSLLSFFASIVKPLFVLTTSLTLEGHDEHKVKNLFLGSYHSGLLVLFLFETETLLCF